MGIKRYIKQILSGYNPYGMIFGLIMSWCIFAFVPEIPQTLRYLCLMIWTVYNFVHLQKISILYCLILLYIPFEIIIVEPNDVYQSWDRFLLFALVIFAVSPCISSSANRSARLGAMKIMLMACCVIGVGSLFANFLGINYATTFKIDNHMYAVGLFSGLTFNSMLLGPISSIAAIYLFYCYMKTKSVPYLIAMVCSMGSVLLSASRSAFLSAIAGLAICILKLSGSTSKFIRIALITTTIICLSFPLWEDTLMSGVVAKNKGNTEAISYDSRQVKWDQRWDEFESNQMMGVGFSALGKDHVESARLSRGVIEPGTSWISILSMLGIIGFCLTIPLLATSYYTSFMAKSMEGGLYCGLLTFFFVHMVAEGYIFAGGSFLCFALWLTIGCAQDLKYTSNPKSLAIL